MIKINGAGHILDTPIYQFGDWVLPTLHDMVGWIENFCILAALFFLARLAKGGIILTSMGTNPTYLVKHKIFNSMAIIKCLRYYGSHLPFWLRILLFSP